MDFTDVVFARREKDTKQCPRLSSHGFDIRTINHSLMMRPIRVFSARQHALASLKYITFPLRSSSTTASQLHDELTSRPHNVIYDYLSPTPSHLLDVSLRDFLPPSCQSSRLAPVNLALPLTNQSNPLPQGHHLVYFPPPTPHSELLPDGTDTLHSPGPPFARRLWAGGSLSFNSDISTNLSLDGSRAACVEGIRNVTFKQGAAEDQLKVFVQIERRIGLVGAKGDGQVAMSDEDIKQRFLPQGEHDFGLSAVLERRDLVFMSKKSDAEAKENIDRAERVIKRTYIPDLSRSSITAL